MDYEYPLRNMQYDVAQYQKQVAEIRREIRANPVGLETGEYMYGFKKDSKLYSLITFSASFVQKQFTFVREG